MGSFSVVGTAVMGRGGVHLHLVPTEQTADIVMAPPKGNRVMQLVKEGTLAAHPSKTQVGQAVINATRIRIQKAFDLVTGLQGGWNTDAQLQFEQWLLEPATKYRKESSLLAVEDLNESGREETGMTDVLMALEDHAVPIDDNKGEVDVGGQEGKAASDSSSDSSSDSESDAGAGPPPTAAGVELVGQDAYVAQLEDMIVSTEQALIGEEEENSRLRATNSDLVKENKRLKALIG